MGNYQSSLLHIVATIYNFFICIKSTSLNAVEQKANKNVQQDKRD
jgi:hypothetical protein